ncbi:MAG: glycogen/starch/alpha-glucan phosphorylase [Gemmataceae bacterium]|nr:glycogen/starch/alpha-glucan phosphorylase [Gemmataceae bacterium]
MKTMPRTPKTSPTQTAAPEDVRTSNDPAAIARAFRDHLRFQFGRFPKVATRNDRYMALAHTVRDHLLHHWVNTAQAYLERESRTICYLSAEFLMGPQLGNNLVNLGLTEQVRQAMAQEGLDLDELLEHEAEPGLGNGGLGRLAACYLDSMATVQVPSIGYGIRYEFGIFEQAFRDGWQIEVTDKWLRLGNPWEIPRPEIVFDLKLGGYTESYHDEEGRYRVRWIPNRVVRGMAYDTPVLGYRNNTANLLRLWKAEAAESFDFQAFNTGDYYGAVLQKMTSENTTKVLYPNDEKRQGKQLRLEQQYFFASCALQDMIRIYLQKSKDLSQFHRKFVVQLNDTHPAIAVAELMRLLVDEHNMDWEKAWDVTQQTFAYTNHTLLPEALERWPVPLFASVLPRHLEIIYELNRRFLNEVRAACADDGKIARLSLIDEHGEKYVRMANVACVGSQAINGVAQLHSDLLRDTVLRDFYELWPQKFTNVTNGVTPRRFLVLSNPRLAALISERIGDRWVNDLDELCKLEPLADDPAFRKEWRDIKLHNKRGLSKLILQRTGIEVDPESLFDIQVKRLHEYKRQHLNVLHIIALYNRLRHNPKLRITPRTFIFGGKAAPGYYTAKLIIKLIDEVAHIVNNDPVVRGRLKVVMFPNFNVKNAQHVYPAADLSEQISTAGKEASGTGNMKFALNGALTIGTLDGANIEIREHVGAENFFLFGLTAPEVQETKARGYNPWAHYEGNDELKAVLDLIRSGFFSPDDPALFHPLVDGLLQHDDYLLLADFPSYVECQDKVSDAYRDQEHWTRMSILNVARIGFFSSDRAIREYCERIWHIKPEPIEPH